MLMSKESSDPNVTVRTFSDGMVSFEDGNGLTIVLPPCPHKDSLPTAAPAPAPAAQDTARENLAQDNASECLNQTIKELRASLTSNSTEYESDWSQCSNNVSVESLCSFSSERKTRQSPAYSPASSVCMSDHGSMPDLVSIDGDYDSQAEFGVGNIPDFTGIGGYYVHPPWPQQDLRPELVNVPRQSVHPAAQSEQSTITLSSWEWTGIQWRRMFAAAQVGMLGHELYDGVPDLSERAVLDQLRRSERRTRNQRRWDNFLE